MNNPELCPSCQKQKRNTCEFEEVANIIAKGVPPLFRQKLIAPGSMVRDSAAAAHRIIYVLREVARKIDCPKSESVDPNYQGKEYL